MSKLFFHKTLITHMPAPFKVGEECEEYYDAKFQGRTLFQLIEAADVVAALIKDMRLLGVLLLLPVSVVRYAYKYLGIRRLVLGPKR